VSAEACLRATAAFRIADVLFVTSVSWSEEHTARRELSTLHLNPDGTVSLSTPPSPVGEFSYADGCLRYVKDSTAQTRVCQQTILGELEKLLGAQLAALSAVLDN